jgi:hypothetical protein
MSCCAVSLDLKMASRLTVVLVLVLAAGCGARAISPSAPLASSAPSALPVPVPVPALPVPIAAAPAPGIDALKLEVVQVLSVAVTSIALGEGLRIAVLADPPQIGDARGLHGVPLPAALRAKPGEIDESRIFFGRDNEPRIMGSRRSSSGESAIYWRHLANGWRDGREEIGQLGGTTHGGLWGVLGGTDPELVCRAGASCIIKRTTGWTTVPAGPAPRIVALQDGVLWGLDETGIAGIDAHGWSLAIAAPAKSAPRSFWATRGEAWLSTERELFHFQGGAWATLPPPLSEVTAWWGTRADSVWCVGKGGVAHFDGHGFRVAPIAGALHAIQGRSDAEVWLGGDAGLFRVRLLEP